MNVTGSSTLGYWPAPWKTRARVLRNTSLSSLIIAAVVVTYYHSPLIESVSRWLALRRAERACMEFRRPADFVVFEDDPPAVAALTRTPGYLVIQRPWSRVAATYRPPELSALEAYIPLNHPWTGQAQGSFLPDGNIFLHERRTRGGARRLVAVQLDFHPGGVHSMDAGIFMVRTATLMPRNGLWRRTWKEGGSPSDGKLYWPMHCFSAWPQGERIYAGQPAEHDDSAFNIRCLYGGKEWYIEGALIDTPDGPNVVLRLGKGAEILPPTIDPNMLGEETGKSLFH